jgi:signal peptidase I
VLTAVLARGLVVQAFKIPSGSMLPTLQIGDYVLVNPLRYGLRLPWFRGWLLRWSDPRPGDVIVFAGSKQPVQDYVKRVVAVGGEIVEIRNKQVLVDGRPRDVPEGYFTNGSEHVQFDGPRDNFGPAAIPPGQVFVLGDNRDQSVDSRFWGSVDVDEVEGKAFLIYWSADGEDGWVRWERLGRMVR